MAVYFIVNKHTDFVCLLGDAEGSKPLGIKLPLRRLLPSPADKASDAVLVVLRDALQVWTPL